MMKEWVVYAKHTLTQTQPVVRYLARYTYKAAISNSRILQVDENGVQFRWKDYRDAQHKVMTLSAEEFIRRYLLHILPKGFMRIRHFGFLANRCRAAKLARIRQVLQQQTVRDLSTDATSESTNGTYALNTSCRCPKCQHGQLVVCFDVSAKPRRKPPRIIVTE